MPGVGNSFYADMVHGERFWTYVSEELPALVRMIFPLSSARGNNFVAGLSMGGYGALKLGLRKPECFAAAASLSGALDMAWNVLDSEVPFVSFSDIFGDVTKVKNSDNDLFAVVERLKTAKKDIPRLYQACGVDDFLYDQNIRFRDHVRQLGLDLVYEEGPGEHTWEFWDTYIQKVIAWLPLKHTSVLD
jgi:S-formylglutathione hydrolase FrmB